MSTLVTAVVAAELAEALQGDGPFTVFAPINDAFAGLDAAGWAAFWRRRTARCCRRS